MPAVTNLETWAIRDIATLIAQQRIAPSVTDQPDTDEVLGFLEAMRAKAPLGSIILAHTPGGIPSYAIVDGHLRIETIGRVFAPDQFAASEAWPVHLQAPDRGGALAWGLPADGDPLALPLRTVMTPYDFAQWAANVADSEPERAERLGHAAATAGGTILHALIPVYIVHGADPDTLEAMRTRANSHLARR